MQAKALRIILGAVKTTPIAALQVETSEVPLFIRRQNWLWLSWVYEGGLNCRTSVNQFIDKQTDDKMWWER